MTADRLAGIEEHYQHCWAFDPGSGHLDDVNWLIAEIKRLRKTDTYWTDAVAHQAAVLQTQSETIDELRAEVERITLCDAEHLERSAKLEAENERLLRGQ